MDYRELGKKSLKTVLTVDKNVSILEKEVYHKFIVMSNFYTLKSRWP